MFDNMQWNSRYQQGDTPWDTGLPSSELQRVLAEEKVQPCLALELGCGTGTNSIWLAQQGFEVTAVDLSPLALERARSKARQAGVQVNFVAADILQPPDWGKPFAFFFDRGCYHCVRQIDVQRFVNVLDRLTAPGAAGLVLAGNAREPHDPGPPVVTEEQIRAELGRCFHIIWLREFRFDPSPTLSTVFLGWSCWLRKLS